MSGCPDELVLVTGGAGFLGRHLVRHLTERGRPVRVLDDLSTGDHAALPAGVELREGDVRDAAAVRSACEGATTVVHMAGVVGMRLATAHRQLSFDVATIGTRNVIEATGEHVDLVLFSSSAVYGLNEAAVPMREAVAIPRSVPHAYDGGKDGYATGKWEMERFGREAAMAGRRTLTVRPFNVVGDGQSSAYGMVMPTFLQRALEGEPLVVYGDGRQRRCFSEVNTFTRAVFDLMATREAWTPGRNVVNVGSTAETAILDLAHRVIAKVGSDSAIVHADYGSVFAGRRDVTHRVPDSTLLNSLVGEPGWMDVDMIITDILRKLVVKQ
ncbi:NAD-dependent epimerase/dehydratase family protein [Nonomuraea sp. NPDC050451]|uniref:NAD-dependent epimerase/dehydratase family protein n=1 Tax=Nonomuraea sp. NPDC050451 TaxID=3364364 RepID=UPI0037B371E5